MSEELHPDFVADPAILFSAERSAVHRYAWARGMTAMREELTRETGARVVIGGKWGPIDTALPQGGRERKWYASRIPGVLEEILLSMQAQQPLYLIGAFSGCARLAIDVMEGVEREEMTWPFQGQAPHAAEMRRLYEERDSWWGYREMRAFLDDRGIAGLNNGLTEEENRELFFTRDVERLVELVLGGIRKLESAR